MAKASSIFGRQADISSGTAARLNLPKFDTYSVCNLRGGIGKTSLTFNLSYLIDDALIVDTCPQGNLSFFYDKQYYDSTRPTVYDMILPHIIPGLGTAAFVAQKIDATNNFFKGKNSYFIPSSAQLYVLPTQLATALSQTSTLIGEARVQSVDAILYSLRDEINREKKQVGAKKCLIDTSPFFSGATHLVWHAVDALVVPVRTDQQSINSLNLLLSLMSQPSSEFRRTQTSDVHTPKIQLIVLTHCGWSTRKGAQNEPNQQTKMYIEQLYEIVRKNIQMFTTPQPEDHIVLTDDFLGSGRISSAQSKPIELLNPGETASIHRTKVEVNQSVDKIKNQLKFINRCLW